MEHLQAVEKVSTTENTSFISLTRIPDLQLIFGIWILNLPADVSGHVLHKAKRDRSFLHDGFCLLWLDTKTNTDTNKLATNFDLLVSLTMLQFY